MKMFVISDNSDTLVGLRMAGVDGVIAHTEEEARQAIDSALTHDDIGILLINGALAKLCREQIDNIKTSRTCPLLVEIPDRFGNGRDENAIAEYIRTAVGIKI